MHNFVFKSKQTQLLKLVCMPKGKLYVQYTCMESDLTDDLCESINRGNVKSLGIEKVRLVRGQQSMTGNHSRHNISKHGEVVWLNHLSSEGRGGRHHWSLPITFGCTKQKKLHPLKHTKLSFTS